MVFPPMARTAAPMGSSAALADQKERRRPRRVSSDVAPPEMFTSKRGMSSMEVASYTNRLLSTQAYRLCTLGENSNDPGLTANVRLLRTVKPIRQDRSKELGERWDDVCCLRRKLRGSGPPLRRETVSMANRIAGHLGEY